MCAYFDANNYNFDILSFDILSFNILSYNILSFHILSFDILSFNILSFDILSFDILSFDILSFNILSFDILSFNILSFDILDFKLNEAPIHIPQPRSSDELQTGNIAFHILVILPHPLLEFDKVHVEISCYPIIPIFLSCHTNEPRNQDFKIWTI
jgi:hypothetical protein